MLKREMPPVHPGRILKNMYLEPLGLSVTDAAKGLGVSRNALSAIINQRAGISPEMAIKLSEAFGTSAELWNNMQKTYDLWNAKQTVTREGITRFHPVS
ncbi:MAG: HigA family addiction module antitoxin [Bacteroidota bacterium]